MNFSTHDVRLIVVIVVAILTVAGVLALRGWLRVAVFVLGLLVVLYLLSQLGYLPTVNI